MKLREWEGEERKEWVKKGKERILETKGIGKEERKEWVKKGKERVLETQGIRKKKIKKR